MLDGTANLDDGALSSLKVLGNNGVLEDDDVSLDRGYNGKQEEYDNKTS